MSTKSHLIGTGSKKNIICQNILYLLSTKGSKLFFLLKCLGMVQWEWIVEEKHLIVRLIRPHCVTSMCPLLRTIKRSRTRNNTHILNVSSKPRDGDKLCLVLVSAYIRCMKMMYWQSQFISFVGLSIVTYITYRLHIVRSCHYMPSS